MNITTHLHILHSAISRWWQYECSEPRACNITFQKMFQELGVLQLCASLVVVAYVCCHRQILNAATCWKFREIVCVGCMCALYVKAKIFAI
jgi:hypothetical protein